MVTVAELLREHVTLDVECIDRVYLNGYVPKLQTSGQLVWFLVHHLGKPIPSPALLNGIGKAFIAAVRAFADTEHIPIIRFQSAQRKEDVSARYRSAYTGDEGVVFIGIAQEKTQAFKATKSEAGEKVHFDYTRQSAYVNHYYFYIQDADFGPAFIKVRNYAPYALKVCLNGHEWVKQQLLKEGIAFEALDNGFRSCANPERLQGLCDQLGPEHFQAFLAKWLGRLPMPLSPADRQAGFDYRLAIWQLEISRTQVFADPLRGREFFDEVIRENLDLGRPEQIQLLFERKVQKNTPGLLRTRVVQEGVLPSLRVQYKGCHVKQYFKCAEALRTEVTINDPTHLRVRKDISNLPYLQEIGRKVNRRLLDVQRLSQDCTLSRESVQRLVQPTVTEHGQRASGLRFGDPRVVALLAALILYLHLPNGLANRTLRPQVAAYLGVDPSAYSATQMSYDLRRLRLKGLVHRIPSTHRYLVTTYGYKAALFLTKLDARVFRPAFAAMDPVEPIPRPLADAFAEVNRQVNQIIDRAQLSEVA